MDRIRARDPGYKSAPLLQPPIPYEMTDTSNKLKAIVLRAMSISKMEYSQVGRVFAMTCSLFCDLTFYTKIPGLLRRIQHLLRVYYDALISGQQPEEFQYCDVQTMLDMSALLHEVGLTFQNMHSRLRALFRSAPDFETFLFEESMNLGEKRVQASRTLERLFADPYGPFHWRYLGCSISYASFG